MTTQQTFNCPANSICILNVTSGIGVGDISGSTVNAQTAYSLDVYVDGNTAQCKNFIFNCPINGDCAFYGSAGGRYFYGSDIYAKESSYLYIETDLGGPLFYSNIYCPTSSIKGGANGKCVINMHHWYHGGGYPPLRYATFYAVEGYKDLRLTCTIDNGEYCGWYKIYCGVNYQYSCGVAQYEKPYQNGYIGNSSKSVYGPDGWYCSLYDTNNNVYNEIPQECTDFTYHPIQLRNS